MLNVSKTEEISEKCPKNSLIFCKIRNKKRTRIIGAARAEAQARLMSLPSRDDNG